MQLAHVTILPAIIVILFFFWVWIPFCLFVQLVRHLMYGNNDEEGDPFQLGRRPHPGFIPPSPPQPPADHYTLLKTKANTKAKAKAKTKSKTKSEQMPQVAG